MYDCVVKSVYSWISTMKEVCLIFLLVLPHILSLTLHYNQTTKTYNDLLVSISPDIPGRPWLDNGSLFLLDIACREQEQ